MQNNVVEAVVQAYQESGYTTLRFNFRGVGGSGGTHENGAGEQEDVRAALEYVRDRGKTKVDLAGYSFGAWVNAMGLETYSDVRRMVMVSPPVNFIDVSFLGFSPKIRLIVGGSTDDIAPTEKIERYLERWNPDVRFEVIRGADHFYWGKEEDLKRVIRRFLSSESEGGPVSIL
jgi:alpha/beta superfamily hydrolase